MEGDSRLAFLHARHLRARAVTVPDVVRYFLAITPTVRKVLRALLHLDCPAYAPEIAAVAALSHQTVRDVLRRLEANGWVGMHDEETNRYRPRTPRSFCTLTERGRRDAEKLDLPPLAREYTEADPSPEDALRRLLHENASVVSPDAATAALRAVLVEVQQLPHSQADRFISKMLAALTPPHA